MTKARHRDVAEGVPHLSAVCCPWLPRNTVPPTWRLRRPCQGLPNPGATPADRCWPHRLQSRSGQGHPCHRQLGQGTTRPDCDS